MTPKRSTKPRKAPEIEPARQRMMLLGAEHVADVELLAMILGGPRGFDRAIALVRDEGGFLGLDRADPQQLALTHGVGLVGATAIAAAFELGRRVARIPEIYARSIRGPDDVVEYLRAAIGSAPQELFLVLGLDVGCRLHRQLTDGITVELPGPHGETLHPTVRLIDFTDPTANELLVVNQFTVKTGKKEHRPDVVVFVNGLPLAVIELKNAVSESATTTDAIEQLQTYKRKDRIEALFVYNAVLVGSDGVTARIGSLTAGPERFMPWRTIEGEREAPTSQVALEVLVRGVFEPRRFLDLIRSFTVFETSDERVEKKIAGYHQFHAVQTAQASTIRAAAPEGTRKVGVVWHTQGSGKSLTMVFYAGRLIADPALENPTIVVLTDRNDLDDQLFGTFSRCEGLLRQKPQQIGSREEIKTALDRGSGGILFTTIQKFFPEERGGKLEAISARRNIIVIADEAHRSQYGLSGRVVKEGNVDAYTVYGYAKHLRDALPNASYIAFTGTPVELNDRNTRTVFGDHISVYDIQQAVEDGATVPIYFESRVAKLHLDEDRRPQLDEEFDEVTENEEETYQGRLKTKWAALQALVGADDRIEQVAQDLVDHFERRNKVMPGKAMAVCMSREICVRLYDAIVALRPDWHDPDDAKGQIKVVMTGDASNKQHLQDHLRSKGARAKLAKRFKQENDPFKLVIVRDMWLTGFDAPCLHTMYIDKPMQGAPPQERGR